MDQKLINPLMKTSCGFVIYCEGSNEILLGRETNSNNFWSIPKGGKEDGENSLEAALRELYEESNISKEFIKSCDVFELKPQMYGSKRKRLVPFLAICKTKPDDLKCNAYFTDSSGESLPEFSKLQWFDFDAVLNGEVKVHGTQMKCFFEAKEKI
jgi:8-oxo-dGTP pyrophosphatase MutT (NUDIX family)